MAKKPIVGVIGGTVSGNRGAEAMLVTVIGRLREKFPDAEFKVFSYYPKQDRALVTQPYIDILSCKPASLVLRFFPFAAAEWLVSRVGLHLPDGLLTRVIRELRMCDVLVDIGGVTFVGGRELYLPFNILTIWPAMLLGVPVVKLAQALGPFGNPLTRIAAKIFLPPCRQIFARGGTTEKHLRGLSLQNVTRAADVAFLFQPDYSLTQENEEKNNAVEAQLQEWKAAGKRIIAIAPSSLVYKSSLKVGKDYAQSILDLVVHFDRADFDRVDFDRVHFDRVDFDREDIHFLFLPNSNRETSEKGRNNDLMVLRVLRDRARRTLPDYLFQRMSWVLWDANTRSLRQILACCDLLMTSRFHAMIAGLALGIPTLVIGWSHKYLEALADFGLEKYAADFGDQDVNLADLAGELLERQEQVHQQITAKLADVRALSEGQFEYLEHLIAEKSSLA